MGLRPGMSHWVHTGMHTHAHARTHSMVQDTALSRMFKIHTGFIIMDFSRHVGGNSTSDHLSHISYFLPEHQPVWLGASLSGTKLWGQKAAVHATNYRYTQHIPVSCFGLSLDIKEKLTTHEIHRASLSVVSSLWSSANTERKRRGRPRVILWVYLCLWNLYQRDIQQSTFKLSGGSVLIKKNNQRKLMLLMLILIYFGSFSQHRTTKVTEANGWHHCH